MIGRKRIINLFLVLLLVVAAAVGSWVAGSSIKSPAEVAARKAPPSPSPILVPIEKRLLQSEIVTRGTAGFGLSRQVSLVPSPLKPTSGIIGTLPLRATSINEGDVLLTASGRPTFVIQGEVPAFRDLVLGISGEDVLQLEQGLSRLGFDPVSIDGIYDENTGNAISDWYAASGWETFSATPEELAHSRMLERELAVAIGNQESAKFAVEYAPLAVESERANAVSAGNLAAMEVAAKKAVRDRVMANQNSTFEARTRATADLSVAEAAEAAAKLAGELAIRAASDSQTAARREVQSLQKTIDFITEDLATARSKAKVRLPVDEIVFIPNLPVRVERVNVAVGDVARGPLLTVTNNQLTINSSLPLDEAPLVHAGMPVAIDEPAFGIKAVGEVNRVAQAPGTLGVDGFHFYFEVRVTETSSLLEGFSLRLTIPVESTNGEVLAVPISALSLAADGTSRLQVEIDGALKFIPVEPGLAANGFVEVTPVSDTITPGQLVVIGIEQP